MTKIFKQSGPNAQIVVFFAFLVICCLGALGLFSASAYLKGWINPLAIFPTVTSSATASPLPQSTATNTPSPEGFATLTPLPVQFTSTPTLLPDQATEISTLTPVQRTIIPTLEPPSPTIELTLEDTPTPESDKELRDVQLEYIDFQIAFQTFESLDNQLDSDQSLIRNEKWKARMFIVLSSLERSAIRLAAVKITNPNYAAYASYLDQLSSETGFMASAYRKGLDKTDLISLQVAKIHLQSMNDLLLKIEQEYKAVKSRLATPALTQLPAPTSTP